MGGGVRGCKSNEDHPVSKLLTRLDGSGITFTKMVSTIRGESTKRLPVRKATAPSLDIKTMRR